jgi:DNA primase
MAIMTAPQNRRRIDAADLAELGRRVDFPAMLQGHGIEVRRQGAGLVCSMRQERTPSCHVYAPGQGRLGHKGWTYWDFGSNEGGDVITYLTDHQGMAFLDAVRHLADLTGFRPDGLGQGEAGAVKPRPRPTPMPAKIETPTMPPDEQAEACQIYLDALCEVYPGAEAEGAAYLGPNKVHGGRNVMPKGWPSVAFHQPPEIEDELTRAVMPHAELLIRAGLMKPADDRGPVRLQWGAFYDQLILLAHHDERGRVAALSVRRYKYKDGDRYPKYLHQTTERGAQRMAFGLPSLYLPPWLAWKPQHAGELLIVEGPLDALGAVCLGFSAVGLGGRVQAGGATDQHSRTARMLEPHLPALRGMKRIGVMPDNDADREKAAQGIAMAGKLVAMLRAADCRAEIVTIDKLGTPVPPECKDMADLASVRQPA